MQPTTYNRDIREVLDEDFETLPADEFIAKWGSSRHNTMVARQQVLQQIEDQERTRLIYARRTRQDRIVRNAVLLLIAAFILGYFAWQARGAEPKFHTFGTKTYANALDDIRQHTGTWDTYEDRMTGAHENTHQIHSECRGRTGKQAFYVLENRLFLCEDPQRVTLADVAANRPFGEVRQLYLVDAQKWWNDTPTYLVDEAVAYTNGAIVGKYLNVNGWQYENQRATELTAYSLTLCDIIEEKESKDLARVIRLFLLWNSRRIPKPIFEPQPARPSRPLPPPSPMLPFPWDNE